MTYTPTDPREALVGKGNALLDVFYHQHIWEQKYPLMAEAMKKGPKTTTDEIAAITDHPEFMEALIERMDLDNASQRTSAEYLMLRMTIEALEGKRPDMSI